MERQSGQYFGQVDLKKQVDNFYITTSQHAPQTIIPNHHHVNPYFTLVLEGIYKERVGSKVYTFRKGDVVFHPAEAEHSNQFDQSPALCFNVEVPLATTNQYADLYLLPVDGYQAIDLPSVKSYMVCLLEEVQRTDAFSELIIGGIVRQLIGLFLRQSQLDRRASRWVDQVKAFINETPQQNLTLEQLSQLTGLSADYLCRHFSRTQGMTLGQYMRQQKVARACNLLEGTRMTTEEIAFELGFSDASHFNKVFKRIMSLSPSTYRHTICRQSHTIIPR
ncbi:helix-turn-helix domain-containing protein [Telluribacter humicola]|uniref:helix-turn-helix domain-containing protein n=1 Tax=Telluribacter humicola TaxID=1720261 RepID=UPI001A956A78|nr:helix-turn-helix domain-containing protein [Telluribacter humicola]